ncbi:hypothetical protein LCGC14_0354320 [marine sediment metagenome]|uniref:DUF3871 family protein n=1 Tax=marine sediment metagenome TaxID=412755 RepID=A0A0F9TSS0_9ZZZZ|nr:DUF3871 family protein [Maribacter sp.]HDZ04674.1 DUF3871 family protein [Maribacter sp.]
METLVNTSMIVEDSEVIKKVNNGFIEANTIPVSIQHLKTDCIIPVFSRDNESTISHYDFIAHILSIVKDHFPQFEAKNPDIRVSHMIKGRIPSAAGKPKAELEENEKTIYYERCAFLIELAGSEVEINGNKISLTVGGVRSYNLENLYGCKTDERFKVFIGYKNRVCTNMCISTDGFLSDLRIGSVNDFRPHLENLFDNYNWSNHVDELERFSSYNLNQEQFAHLIGKFRMYQYLPKDLKTGLFPLEMNDSQINKVVRDYYKCPNFGGERNGDINLWKLFNLFTEANKSSYIDNYLDRGLSAYKLVQELGFSIESNSQNWFLNN